MIRKIGYAAAIAFVATVWIANWALRWRDRVVDGLGFFGAQVA